jgi:hypothetical protein
VLCRSGKAIDFFVSDGLPVEIQMIPDESGWMFNILYEVSSLGNRRYFSESFEAYFVCTTGTFKATITPDLTTSKTIWLGSGAEKDIQKNIDKINSQDIETFVADLGTQIISDNGKGHMLPDSYTIKPSPSALSKWHDNIVDGLAIKPVRSIKIDGTGITAIEYEIKALRLWKPYKPHVSFLQTPLGGNIFAISMEDEVLKKGQRSTVVIMHLERGL